MRRMVTDQEIAALGGTKLYKHTITLTVDIEEEPVEVTADLINTISTSLAGQAIPDPETTIHGILSYDYSYNPILYIDEYSIVWYYISYTEIRMDSISGNILTDTVVAL